MLKEERYQYILDRLSASHRIYVTALSKELNISDDTLRRDLAELDQQGLLTKVHGGAIAKSGIPHDFLNRLEVETEAKQRMATKVIPFFKPHDVILIDGGTSNLAVVRQLPKSMPLTIYTNSFPIVNELFQYPEVEVIFLGGRVFNLSQVTVGISVYQQLQTIRPDWLVLGICSVHPQLGLSGPEREESQIKRFMVERAQKSIVLADNHKLNKTENYPVCSLGDIDYLIVEEEQKQQLLEQWPVDVCRII